jgi:hypothetical protein
LAVCGGGSCGVGWVGVGWGGVGLLRQGNEWECDMGEREFRGWMVSGCPVEGRVGYGNGIGHGRNGW